MSPPADPTAELRNALGRGGLVIVVGTGVSMAASRDPSTGKCHPEASWAGLLENGLEWLKQKALIPPEEVAAHITFLRSKRSDIHHFVSAAEDVTCLMGGAESQHFSEWLTRTVGSITAHDRQLLDALDELRRQGHLLTTTNYDGLLLDQAGSLKPVTWKEPDAFLRAARNKEADKVIFLHGYWRQPSSVILDWGSYQQIARDEQYREDFVTVWKMTTWLYVGCGVNGLSDPDFGLLLERYGKRARTSDLWDFCLVRSSQRDEFQAHFDKKEFNICAVSFGDSHDQLPEYLRSLLPAAAPAKPALSVVVELPVEPITAFLRVTDSFFQYRAPTVVAGSVASGSRGDFRFTAEEFRSGAVHRAQVVDVALKRLSRDGCVWLEGPSAGGKTTVCLHLVAEWNHQGCEPLYLDLGDELDAEQAAREMTAHAKPGRMFILDNVHDEPKRACALLDQWRAQSRDSVMVLLGWPAAVRPGHDYLSGHRAAIVTVAVQPEDWIGVYQSTFRHIRGVTHVPPVPPPQVVKEWDDTFAADLVTFQYALAAGLRTGHGNAFQIEPAAADRYVREKYLAPCSDAERHDLFLLAWLAELGIAAGEESTPSSFTHSRGCGLIRSTFHGRFRDHVRYQTWHRSLVHLLLRLAPHADRERHLFAAASLNPACAGILALRLRNNAQDDLPAKVFQHTLSQHPSLADWFGDNLTRAAAILRQAKTLIPANWSAVALQLSAQSELDKLVSKAFATPLHFLVTFLQFTGQSAELKPVREALSKALAADAKLPADQSRLQAQAFATPLGDLVTFLRFTGQSSELKPVHEALCKALAADAKLPADQSRLQAQAFATPLGDLVTFLRFTGQSSELKPVHEALCKALAADAKLPADQSWLVRTARNASFEHLRGFLNGVQSTPDLAWVAPKIERDGECARVLRIEVDSQPSRPTTSTRPPEGPAMEGAQALAISDMPQLRSDFDERIEAGIDRVLALTWEAIPLETTEEDRLRTAKRKAADIISRLSPQIRRQVGAYFQTKNWEPLKAADPRA